MDLGFEPGHSNGFELGFSLVDGLEIGLALEFLLIERLALGFKLGFFDGLELGFFLIDGVKLGSDFGVLSKLSLGLELGLLLVDGL